GGLLFERILQPARALGEAILFAGEAAEAIVAGRAPAQLRRDLPLGVGQLPRLELRIAESPPLFVGLARLHLPFELAQPLERLDAAGRGLPLIAPAQIVGRAAHGVGDLFHLTAGRTL